ncbi:MAG: ATP synthase delta/epsilon chain alpha-helix domain-containing protein, partial [Burkholderiaceae bacterium]
RGKDLDEARAEAARRDVEEAINNTKGDFDMAAAQAELAVLAAQVAALRRFRKKS